MLRLHLGLLYANNFRPPYTVFIAVREWTTWATTSLRAHQALAQSVYRTRSAVCSLCTLSHQQNSRPDLKALFLFRVPNCAVLRSSSTWLLRHSVALLHCLQHPILQSGVRVLPTPSAIEHCVSGERRTQQRETTYATSSEPCGLHLRYLTLLACQRLACYELH